MSFLLNKLATKKDVDIAIKTTVDKVLVLRFGRESDAVCLQLDDVVLTFKFAFGLGIFTRLKLYSSKRAGKALLIFI